MNSFDDRLKAIYATVGNAWVDKNSLVFQEAKTCGLALAGSIGGAVASKKAKKIPGDIDFVCKDVGSAMRFQQRLQDKLFQYPTYWQVQINNRTSFCPENVETHVRIHAPFWLPICVFVLKEGCSRQWFTKEAYPVQFFTDVTKAAHEMEERDGKPRPILELDIELDDFDETPDSRLFSLPPTPAYPASL